MDEETVLAIESLRRAVDRLCIELKRAQVINHILTCELEASRTELARHKPRKRRPQIIG